MVAEYYSRWGDGAFGEKQWQEALHWLERSTRYRTGEQQPQQANQARARLLVCYLILCESGVDGSNNGPDYLEPIAAILDEPPLPGKSPVDASKVIPGLISSAKSLLMQGKQQAAANLLQLGENWVKDLGNESPTRPAFRVEQGAHEYRRAVAQEAIAEGCRRWAVQAGTATGPSAAQFHRPGQPHHEDFGRFRAGL